MTDTQWPRFEVFLQESEEAAIEHVGSVHAADPEIALLNARDVFVRRPRCTRLFVVLSEQVLFKTSEELRDDEGRRGPETGPPEQSSPDFYLVFAKAGHRGPLKSVDRVETSSGAAALEAVIGRLGINRSSFWAAVGERSLACSDPADYESMFAPAEAKSYKLHSDYPVNKLMREQKK